MSIFVLMSVTLDVQLIIEFMMIRFLKILTKYLCCLSEWKKLVTRVRLILTSIITAIIVTAGQMNVYWRQLNLQKQADCFGCTTEGSRFWSQRPRAGTLELEIKVKKSPLGFQTIRKMRGWKGQPSIFSFLWTRWNSSGRARTRLAILALMSEHE